MKRQRKNKDREISGYEQHIKRSHVKRKLEARTLSLKIPGKEVFLQTGGGSRDV